MRLTTVSIRNKIITFRSPRLGFWMPDITKRHPYTHTAYFFIRVGVRKGRVFGYWKDGGGLRPMENSNFSAFSDMLPRGWDGRIRFIKFGDPPPEDEPSVPQRPGAASDDDDGDGENFES